MAKRVFLEFEHDIEAFEKKVDELRELAENTSESAVAVSIDAEVAQLENKSLIQSTRFTAIRKAVFRASRVRSPPMPTKPPKR